MRRLPLHHRSAYMLAGSVLLLAACGASGPPASVGFIDMQAALQQTHDGQAARARMMQSFEARQRELDTRQRALIEMRTRLEGGGGPMAQAVGASATCPEVITYAQELTTLQRDFASYQQQLQVEEQALVNELMGRMRRMADRLAEEHGVVVVFDTEMYAAPGVRRIDLTSELVERYDAEYSASP